MDNCNIKILVCVVCLSTDFYLVLIDGGFKWKFNTVKVKGKVVPLQAWSSPEGSRKLSFSDFMTMAQDGGKVVSLKHRSPLTPGNAPGTHLY